MRLPSPERRRPLADLLTGFAVADPIPARAISGVAVDSRAVTPGTLFLAYAGTQAHGLDYAEQAIERGAAAIAWDDAPAPRLAVPTFAVPRLAARASAIAARFYHEPASRLFVTGITGTDGKTSCAWLLAQALGAANTVCGYIGTLGYGLLDALTNARHTTPDAVALQAWLARLLDAGARAVALEVSSHALAQHRTDGVAFDVAVLTQIGRDHLDYHGDATRYAAAKRRLFESPGLAYAVLNADDTAGRAWFADLPPGVAPVAYGRGELAPLADRYVSLRRVDAHRDGLTLDIRTHAGDARLESSLIGAFNAMNLAAILAVLLVRGYVLNTAVAALARAKPVPGRMERVPGRAGQPLVLVDYAHTPNALVAALEAARAHAENRLLCVFGCGGERDRGKRAPMGRAAGRLADAVWLTDDNPRGESPAAIVEDIRAGMTHAPPTVEHDRGRAIASAIGAAAAGDVVLIAGKGHETTQQIGAEYRAFDDRTAARAALEAA